MALRGMGPAAKTALPALRKALQDKTPRIRDLAAQALEELEGGGERSPGTRSAARITSRAAVLPSFKPGSPAIGRSSMARGAMRCGARRACSRNGLPKVPGCYGNGKAPGEVIRACRSSRASCTRWATAPPATRSPSSCWPWTWRRSKEIWAARVGPPHADGPRCTPTVDGELLYALGTDGDLVCLETATGKERWHRNLVKDFGGQMMSMWKFSESPLVDGDRLICTPGGKDAALVALNKKTGEMIWKSKLPELGPKGKDGAGYSSAVVAEFDGVRQYVQIVGRGAVGVAADTGKFLWGYNRIANEVANIPTPIVRGNYVFVTTSYHTGAALLKISRKGDGFVAEEVYYLDPNRFENHHGGVVLVGDYLYGGHGLNRGQPVCIHLPTGEIAWKAKQPFPGSAAVLYADGHLIFRYDRGDVALVEATPQEFRLKASFKPITSDGPAWAHPVIHDKRLYLRHGNVLACYDLRP